MLAQAHRFHGYGSLRGVYQRGQGFRGSLISVKFATRDPRKAYRVAVVVSKKVHKSAVVRNRIRRRVYELVRTADDQPAPGTDVVFTVFSEQVADLEASKLKTMINELLQKVINQATASGQTPVKHAIVDLDISKKEEK
ncbi:MAG: putative Ribonuclease [Candidatus Saccharibacteria bacterium]|nr:putative Ribonuclease [Candidatus Saccharibacteria bacterium]